MMARTMGADPELRVGREVGRDLVGGFRTAARTAVARAPSRRREGAQRRPEPAGVGSAMARDLAAVADRLQQDRPGWRRDGRPGPRGAGGRRAATRPLE